MDWKHKLMERTLGLRGSVTTDDHAILLAWPEFMPQFTPYQRHVNCRSHKWQRMIKLAILNFPRLAFSLAGKIAPSADWLIIIQLFIPYIVMISKWNEKLRVYNAYVKLWHISQHVSQEICYAKSYSGNLAALSLLPLSSAIGHFAAFVMRLLSKLTLCFYRFYWNS